MCWSERVKQGKGVGRALVIEQQFKNREVWVLKIVQLYCRWVVLRGVCREPTRRQNTGAGERKIQRSSAASKKRVVWWLCLSLRGNRADLAGVKWEASPSLYSVMFQIHQSVAILSVAICFIYVPLNSFSPSFGFPFLSLTFNTEDCNRIATWYLWHKCTWEY